MLQIFSPESCRQCITALRDAGGESGVDAVLILERDKAEPARQGSEGSPARGVGPGCRL